MKKFPFCLSALLLLAAAVLPLSAYPVGSGGSVGPVAKRGGLSIALNTSGWQFTVTDNPTFVAQTFSAEAILRNDSAADATFTFSNAGDATTKFGFSILNADGEEIWHSDADVASASVITQATLAARSRWSRALSIPLTPTGAALAPGLYTLRAELAANPNISASTAFQVQTVPVIQTGISGQIVLPGNLAFTVGTRVSINVISAPFATTNTIGKHVIPLDSFHWTGTTDAEGKFIVAAPAGNYVVTAYGIQGPPPNPSGPIPLYLILLGTGSASAAVVDGALTPVTITLKRFSVGPISPIPLRGAVPRAR